MFLKQPDLLDVKRITNFLQTYPDSDQWIAGTSSLHRYHGRVNEWIQLMQNWAHGKQLPGGRVPVIQWLVLDAQEQMVGAINLRPVLNDYLLHTGGQVGYVVHPDYRGEGLATWMLGQVLHEAHLRGSDELLITCRASNKASQRVIEKWGGQFEDQRQEKGIGVKRFWVATLPQRPDTYKLTVS